MHNNYYFLKRLSTELHSVLQGCLVSECFCQNKEELIIRFENPKANPFFIKASLQSEFCCLSFPKEFNRARKNSVDLFDPLIGQRVTGIRQFQNERSFALDFTNNLQLVFKMHGNRANLILAENEKPKIIFRNHLTADLDIQINNLNRTIDWSFEAFTKNHQNLSSLYFTFGKPVWDYLNKNGFDKKDPKEQWLFIQNVLKFMEEPSIYINKAENTISLSLFKDEAVVKTFTSPIEAITEFFYQHTRLSSLEQQKNEVVRSIKIKLANHAAYLKKAIHKKNEIENDRHYKVWADLLMANLHVITPGTESLTLPDFYSENKPVEIKLKKEFSAQKNAEIFYRKSKNRQIEIQKITDSITAKQIEIEKLNTILTAVEHSIDLNNLRQQLNSLGLKQKAEKEEKPLPYHEMEYHGFKIWIGKNAQHNDTLTLKHTYKEDLWMHAKDVPGSHVVIKFQSGKPFPKDVIERAAEVAAYYSKRKTDSLCPVAFTPKKFVRKRKGDPAGMVIVEREEVILVEPKGY